MDTYGWNSDLGHLVIGATDPIGKEMIRLALLVGELETEVKAKEAVLHMAVARLGGLVEGAPTHRGNFLQRIDALVRREEENALLRRERALLVKLEKARTRILASIFETGGGCAAEDVRSRGYHADRLKSVEERLGAFVKAAMSAIESLSGDEQHPHFDSSR